MVIQRQIGCLYFSRSKTVKLLRHMLDCRKIGTLWIQILCFFGIKRPNDVMRRRKVIQISKNKSFNFPLTFTPVVKNCNSVNTVSSNVTLKIYCLQKNDYNVSCSLTAFYFDKTYFHVCHICNSDALDKLWSQVGFRAIGVCRYRKVDKNTCTMQIAFE